MTAEYYDLDLSFCMIAKNEEHYLSRHCPVISPLISEFIFVDTGSTDRSMEIARQYGARIFQKKWENDFAAVRNYALKQATKKWILVLDADEIISPRDFPALASCLKSNPDAGGFVFRIRNYLNDPDYENWLPNLADCEEGKGYKGFTEFTVVKLFENKPWVHYTGAAHDLVEYSIADRPKVFTDILIHHYGMALGKERDKAKDEDYLKQLQQDLIHHPRLFKTRYTLGRQLFRLDRFQEAEKEFLASLQIRPESDTAFLNLGMTYVQMKEYGQAAECLKRSLKINSSFSEAWNSLGVVFAGEKHFAEAESHFRKACKLNPYSPKFINNLASSLLLQGKAEEAFDLIEKILKDFDDYVPALVNRLKILVIRKDYQTAMSVARRILLLDKEFAPTVQDIIKDITI